MGRRSSRNQPSPAAVTVGRTPPNAADSWRVTVGVLAVAVLLTILAFSNAVQGEFVHDDEKQIAANPLIQQPGLLSKALVSDVWAFKGEKGQNWSNYWRPAFIVWLAWNWSWFGAEPAGWHVGNILLHLLATGLGFFVLRAIGAGLGVAASVTWLFAVHPVHVESVTWISGSPDPMVTALLFGAFLCHLAAQRRGSIVGGVGAALLYAGALLCKEIAVVFPAIVFLAEIGLDARAGMARALRRSLPYVGVTAAYLAARLAIGMRHLIVPGAPGIDGVVLSAPTLLLFYVRQAFLPASLGPTYALEAVTRENVSLANFWLPLAACGALAYGAVLLLRRGPMYRLTLLWFALPLAPVFDVRAFLPEDLVHDRYLYLPLFGALAFAANATADAWRRVGGHSGRGWVAGLALAVFLVPVTRTYNRAWLNEVALWERAVETNPEAAFARAQLGEAYRRAGRAAEARQSLERALEINPNLTTAHVAIGAVALREGRLAEAESHLRQVLGPYPDHGPALEQLGLVLQKAGRLDEAIAVLERARSVNPYRAAQCAVNIAVLHKMANRSGEALRELEALRDRIEAATDPAVLRAWVFLGEIYREQGQRDRAAAAYARYLEVTAGATAPDVLALRNLVVQQLRKERNGD